MSYAISNWGSKGSKEWKKETNAFKAVSLWFPEDREACAKALNGMAAIYFRHLTDYRRGILTARMLEEKYPEQRGQCASALAKMGWSHYMIKEFDKSRKAF